MPEATTADHIAAAIAEMYASEPTPEQLAEQLRHVAAANGLDERAVLSWIHDRPRHEMSTSHFISLAPTLRPPVTIGDLQRRVLEYARQCVATRLISVRQLARVTGWSQPYMQLVLSGQRPFRPEMADAIIVALQITPLDLYTVQEFEAMIESSQRTQRLRIMQQLDPPA